MPRTLYLDCLSGISGDMTVGALCDLGVAPATIEAELRKLSLGETRFAFERQTRQGIEGLRFSVEESGHAHGRSYEQICRLIGQSALSDFVSQKARAVFERIALAEAKIHGRPVETVGFHEVGAIDSIADIVGVCIALEELGRPRVIVAACFSVRWPSPAAS